MAGDWIKMEVATPDKPEVLAMTVKMGWDDPDLTVGKLFRVWRWFDQHTVDGNAAGVTTALLDRIAGVTGFAAAMASVGWLVATDDGITLPSFEKHCGKTAKQRAQTANRVANHKSNAKGNGASVTDALPREEKRREDKKKESAPKGTRLPTDWELPTDWANWASGERPDLNIDQTAQAFADYWHGIAGSKGVKLDWLGTWRNWVRRQEAPRRHSGGQVRLAGGFVG